MDPTEALWLIGAGPMARRYAEVLIDRGQQFRVIGRGEASAAAFEVETGVPAHRGGLDAALTKGTPRIAIVAAPVAGLGDAVLALISAGVKRVLVEKPGAIDPDAMAQVAAAARVAGAEVRVAYNRRFLPSVRLARRMIAEDGGVLGFAFEFSDPGRRIAASAHPPAVKANWIHANGSHVIDLAFHLGGAPARLMALTAGVTDWHPRAARLAGAGQTRDGALFTWRAEYDGPGSWGVEIDTPARRLTLRPLETLSQQLLGSYRPEPVDTPPERNGRKPGLPGLIDAFLDGDPEGLLPDIAASAAQARDVAERMLEGAA